MIELANYCRENAFFHINFASLNVGKCITKSCYPRKLDYLKSGFGQNTFPNFTVFPSMLEKYYKVLLSPEFRLPKISFWILVTMTSQILKNVCLACWQHVDYLKLATQHFLSSMIPPTQQAQSHRRTKTPLTCSHQNWFPRIQINDKILRKTK